MEMPLTATGAVDAMRKSKPTTDGLIRSAADQTAAWETENATDVATDQGCAEAPANGRFGPVNRGTRLRSGGCVGLIVVVTLRMFCPVCDPREILRRMANSQVDAQITAPIRDELVLVRAPINN
jgi:hypothetical protein